MCSESTQAHANRLVSYVNELRTPRNNASANAFLTPIVEIIVYTSWLIIGIDGDVYNIILPTGAVVVFCADAFFRASHLQLLTYLYVM